MITRNLLLSRILLRERNATDRHRFGGDVG